MYKEGILTKLSLNVNKAFKNIDMTFEDIINWILANLVITYNQLKGKEMDAVSCSMMIKVIKEFKSIIDECTYDSEKILIGLRESDNGKVDMFTPKHIDGIDIINRRNKINALHQQMIAYKTSILENAVPYEKASYRNQMEVERGILELKNSLNKLNKNIKLCYGAKKILKDYKIESIVDDFLNVGRSDVLKISSILFEIYGNCRVNIK